MAALRAFDGKGPHAGARRFLLQSLGDTLHLAVGAARAKDEIFGDRSVRMDVKHDQVAGFLIQRRPRQQQRFVPATECFYFHELSLRPRYRRRRLIYFSTNDGNR